MMEAHVTSLDAMIHEFHNRGRASLLIPWRVGAPLRDDPRLKCCFEELNAKIIRPNASRGASFRARPATIAEAPERRTRSLRWNLALQIQAPNQQCLGCASASPFGLCALVHFFRLNHFLPSSNPDVSIGPRAAQRPPMAPLAKAAGLFSCGASTQSGKMPRNPGHGRRGDCAGRPGSSTPHDLP